MKYIVNNSKNAKYRFIYDDLNKSCVYESFPDSSDMQCIEDTGLDFYKLKTYGGFRLSRGRLKNYVLVLDTGGLLFVDLRLCLSHDKYLLLEFSLVLNEGDSFANYIFDYDAVSYDLGFRLSTATGLSSVCFGAVDIPFKIGFYLINLANSCDEKLLHIFEDMLCMEMHRLFPNIHVKSVKEIMYAVQYR